MRFALGLIAAMALFACAHAQDGQPSGAQGWLDAMSAALRASDQSSPVLFLEEDQVQSLALQRRRGDDAAVHEELHWQGKEKAAASQSLFVSKAARSPWRSELLHNNYALRDEGAVSIMGHSARLIRVDARDAHRYGYRVWIDTDTHLPLRWTWQDNAGNVVRQLVWPPASHQHDDNTTSTETLDETTSAQTAPAQSETQTLALGFAQRSEPKLVKLSIGEVRQHVLCDGLAVVSVFDLDAEQQRQLRRLKISSPANSFLSSHGQLLIGEVPAPTLQKLAMAMAQQR